MDKFKIRGVDGVSFDALGDDMKAYEKKYDLELEPNVPVILRLDGHAFHTFTARMGFETPFDKSFKDTMYYTAMDVLKFCGGSRVAYVQSDEITVLMTKDANERSTPFFNNRVQKLCSITASVCSVSFNRMINAPFNGSDEMNYHMDGSSDIPSAYFDCRCFVVPRDKVISIFDWRQRDAMKNAVNSIIYWKERETFSGKRTQRNLDNISTKEKTRILKDKYNVDINDFPSHFIRGACIVKKTNSALIEDVVSPDIIEKYKKQGQTVERHYWDVDYNIPIFKENPDYIEKKVFGLQKV